MWWCTMVMACDERKMEGRGCFMVVWCKANSNGYRQWSFSEGEGGLVVWSLDSGRSFRSAMRKEGI